MTKTPKIGGYLSQASLFMLFLLTILFSIDWDSSVRYHRIICWDEEESHLQSDDSEGMKEHKIMVVSTIL